MGETEDRSVFCAMHYQTVVLSLLFVFSNCDDSSSSSSSSSSSEEISKKSNVSNSEKTKIYADAMKIVTNTSLSKDEKLDAIENEFEPLGQEYKNETLEAVKQAIDVGEYSQTLLANASEHVKNVSSQIYQVVTADNFYNMSQEDQQAKIDTLYNTLNETEQAEMEGVNEAVKEKMASLSGVGKNSTDNDNIHEVFSAQAI